MDVAQQHILAHLLWALPAAVGVNGSGVLEIALPHRGEAFRVVYALQLADDVWVLHAFKKKSKQGIKTPPGDIALLKDRLKRLREALK